MSKTKKIKISAAKRSQHLKAKKKNIKLQYNQMRTEKLRKKLKFGGKRETLSREKESKKNFKRKNASKNNQGPEINDEEMYENVKDILTDSDGEDVVYDNNDEDMGGFENNRRKKKPKDDIDQARRHENRYAKQNRTDVDSSKMEIDLLPIKKQDGEIITRTTQVDISDLNSNEEEQQENDDEEEEEYEDSDDDIVNDENQLNLENKKFLSTADLLLLREQEIEKQKYRIGIICSGILEKPEDKIKNFKALFDLMDERNESGSINFLPIRKLACISMAEIFKDILPEYRVGQVDPKMTKIRKTTLERVTYENALLQQFKKYLTKLEKITSSATKKSSSKSPIKEKMAEVAVICLCELLLTHPYFNYVQNVAQLLVYMLNSYSKSIRTRINECFRTLFENDKRLDMPLFIIRRINHLIKTKTSDVHVELISCFLSLDIKNVNLDAEKEKELKVKKLENFRQRIWSLSKKERKRQKKLRELDKELDETRAEENKKTKYHKLTEITKMIFTIYFRILKRDPNSKLMSACLEGLAEFAHIINFDFFADLIEVLHNLLESSNLGYREELHCIETIFSILSGQGEALNIDPIRFYSHCYKNLFHVDAGYTHNDVAIVLRVLNNVLVKRKKHISSQRMFAFVKRIATLSLHLLHNGTLGCLGIMKTLLQMSGNLDILIDTDNSIGSGNYDPYIDDPEHCNANCTSLYETSLLRNHYHPIVKKFALYVAAGAPVREKESLDSEVAKLSFDELYTSFDGSEMAFNPPIPVPSRINLKENLKRKKFDSNFVQECKKHLTDKKTVQELNFYQCLKE